ncbi:hypothetical protein ZIOFF_030704 [Zingiber officinale]|uniref:Cell wall hydroxyproline-rich glycoprotein n=1 Tax=Zingiber officinale TaxID=94328 RepID=A0A8J5LBX8_ZINOF|nr:hypothetical protein ZIOFF_030704 [Zingiber officinale]
MAGRSISYLLLLFLLPLVSGDGASISRQQLLGLSEGDNGDDLPKDFAFDVEMATGITNLRLRRAYVALQAWKHAMYSDPHNFTENWHGTDLCSYKGVFCASALDDSSVDVIAGIDLNGAGIAGYLPAELGLLFDAAIFHINSNRFCGIIPESFSRLKLLYEFDVSNNRFVGRFPKVLLRLPALKYLDMRFNEFEGALPPSLFNKHLDAIFVNNNHFTSPIPDNFGNSTASVVVLANNKLGGCIPTSIGEMGNTLNEIILLNNDLGGCLPAEIGLLSNATVVDASWNSLVGALPKSLRKLKKLKKMDLSHNVLNGNIPKGVCQLPSLTNFVFSYNYFKWMSKECAAAAASTKPNNVLLDGKRNCLSHFPGQKPSWICGAMATQFTNCSRFKCGASSTEKPTPKPSPKSPKQSHESPLPPTPKPVIYSPPICGSVSTSVDLFASTTFSALSTYTKCRIAKEAIRLSKTCYLLSSNVLKFFSSRTTAAASSGCGSVSTSVLFARTAFTALSTYTKCRIVKEAIRLSKTCYLLSSNALKFFSSSATTAAAGGCGSVSTSDNLFASAAFTALSTYTKCRITREAIRLSKTCVLSSNVLKFFSPSTTTAAAGGCGSVSTSVDQFASTTFSALSTYTKCRITKESIRLSKTCLLSSNALKFFSPSTTTVAAGCGSVSTSVDLFATTFSELSAYTKCRITKEVIQLSPSFSTVAVSLLSSYALNFFFIAA